jgi:hypothetical protein
MQGTQNTEAVAGGALDLDALLSARLLKPRPVTLAGRTWQIRTDLTTRQVVRCLYFMRTGDLKAIWTYLVGTRKDIVAMDRAMDAREAAETTPAKAGPRPEPTPLPYGTAASELDAVIGDLPKLHSMLVQASIYRASAALREFALADEDILERHGYQAEDEDADQGGSSAS